MGTIGHKLDAPRRSYSFEEILLLPGLGKLLPKEIDLSVALGGIKLGTPFISAPMDTVTGSRMAIALAARGALGVIHRNCSVEETVGMLKEVKDADPPRNGCAALDSDGRLAVGAAISPTDIARAEALAKAADILFTDVASFHNDLLIKGAKAVIQKTGKKLVIGNLGTREGVLESVTGLGAENIAAIKVGMGGGSICITTNVTGVGAPVPFAVEQAASALEELGLLGRIPIIADGGIRSSMDIAISLGLGASMVMLGNMFVSCEESLAPVTTREGKAYKTYWGMGSSEARKKRFVLDRYQDFSKGKDVDEGIKMYVEMGEDVGSMIDALSSKLRVSMGYVGAANVEEMGTRCKLVVRKPKP